MDIQNQAIVTVENLHKGMTETKLYVTTQESAGLAWKGCSVLGGVMHILKQFKTQNSRDHKHLSNIGDMRALKFLSVQHNEQSICVVQSIHDPGHQQKLTTISTVVLKESPHDNRWHVENHLMQLEIPMSSEVGTIQLAVVKTNNTTERLFLYYAAKNKFKLFFYDSSTVSTVHQWFPVELPTQFADLKTKLTSAGLMFSTENEACQHSKGPAIPCRFMMDLHTTVKETNKQHCAPYKLVYSTSPQFKHPQRAVQNENMRSLVLSLTSSRENLPPFHVAISADVEKNVMYSINDGKNPYLHEGTKYKFFVSEGSEHFQLFGTSIKTGKEEHIADISKEKPHEVILHGEKCRMKAGEIIPLPHGSSGQIYGTSIANTLGTYMIVVGGIVHIVGKHSKDHKGHKFAELDGKEVIELYHTHEEGVNFITLLTKTTHTNEASAYELWECGFSASNDHTSVKLVAELEGPTKATVFIEDHTKEKNRWSIKKQHGLCISMLLDDFSFYTCTCVGASSYQNRMSDCFASTKVHYQSSWEAIDTTEDIDIHAPSENTFTAVFAT
jgi:hypothetical protein